LTSPEIPPQPFSITTENKAISIKKKKKKKKTNSRTTTPNVCENTVLDRSIIA
jgi:hypothetical protein